jgi:hypothetical protein
MNFGRIDLQIRAQPQKLSWPNSIIHAIDAAFVKAKAWITGSSR